MPHKPLRTDRRELHRYKLEVQRSIRTPAPGLRGTDKTFLCSGTFAVRGSGSGCSRDRGRSMEGISTVCVEGA